MLQTRESHRERRNNRKYLHTSPFQDHANMYAIVMSLSTNYRGDVMPQAERWNKMYTYKGVILTHVHVHTLMKSKKATSTRKRSLFDFTCIWKGLAAHICTFNATVNKIRSQPRNVVRTSDKDQEAAAAVRIVEQYENQLKIPEVYEKWN